MITDRINNKAKPPGRKPKSAKAPPKPRGTKTATPSIDDSSVDDSSVLCDDAPRKETLANKKASGKKTATNEGATKKKPVPKKQPAAKGKKKGKEDAPAAATENDESPARRSTRNRQPSKKLEMNQDWDTDRANANHLKKTAADKKRMRELYVPQLRNEHA